MNYNKRCKAIVGVFVLVVVGVMIVPLGGMISQKSTSKRVRIPQAGQQVQSVKYKQEMVWIKTSDNAIVEIPQWQIDQMRVLQVLFLHKKGENNKNNPIDAAMVTSEQLTLLQMALKNASDEAKFELFCQNLKPDEKANLINGSLTLEVQGLAALLMNQIFSPEIQEKLGATMHQVAGVIAPVVEYLSKGQKKVLKGHSSTVTCVAYSPDGSFMVSGSYDKNLSNLILWNGKTGEQIKILEGHTDGVTCVAYSSDGSCIVSGANDNNLILWNGKTGEQIKILKGHTKRVSCVAYSSDGNYMVSGAYDNNLILWNSKTGEQIKILEGHTKRVSCVAYSSDGNYIVSGSQDNNLILWNGKTGEQIQILKGHINWVNCVAYSPDGNYIISGSYNKNLILWNGKTGEQIKILKGHTGWVNCVAYSPDGNYMVSGADDNNLILWDGKTGERIQILEGHNKPVNCVAYSPDGSFMVSGADGNNLILWNSKTGEQIKILEGHSRAVNCVAYSPNGNYIVSGSEDKSLILWGLINDQVLNYISTQLNIAQARLLYRLYQGKINNVPVVLDKKDSDHQIYLSLPDDVQKLIKAFLSFEESSVFVEKSQKEKIAATEKAVQEKMNEYRLKFKKIAATTADTIKTIKILMKDFDKNSVDYKACEKLLGELELKEAFEV